MIPVKPQRTEEKEKRERNYTRTEEKNETEKLMIEKKYKKTKEIQKQTVQLEISLSDLRKACIVIYTIRYIISNVFEEG